MTAFAPGATFAGYRIVRQIARGGMGIVYQAEMIRTGRSVALKCISGDRADDASYRERFRREADTLMQLVNPRIVPLFDWGEEGGVLYLALAYIDGPTLADVLTREGPLSLQRTIELLAPVAEALDGAHRRGFIHRDVKPANILIDSDGNVWLSDFGLSKLVAANALTLSGTVMGTLGYMSPEQFSGRPLSRELAPRTDIYALGCVLHACLTGAEPYPGETFERVMHDHLTLPPPRLTSSRPDLPPSIDAIAARSLAKDPALRWPTAGAFLAAIREVASEQSAEAVPPAQTTRRTLDEVVRRSAVGDPDAWDPAIAAGPLPRAVAAAVRRSWRDRPLAVTAAALALAVGIAAVAAAIPFGLVPRLPAAAAAALPGDPPAKGQSWSFGMESASIWIPSELRGGCTHQDPPDPGDIAAAATEMKGCPTGGAAGAQGAGIVADYWFFPSEADARASYAALLGRFGLAAKTGGQCAGGSFEDAWHHGDDGGRLLCVVDASAASAQEPQLFWTRYGDPTIARLRGASLDRLERVWLGGGIDARPPIGAPAAGSGSQTPAMTMAP